MAAEVVSIDAQFVLGAFATSVGVIGILIGILARVMISGIYSKMDSCHDGLSSKIDDIKEHGLETSKKADYAHDRISNHQKDFHSK
jgi:hypothetical protein